jgi:hypothetical protein
MAIRQIRYAGPDPAAAKMGRHPLPAGHPRNPNIPNSPPRVARAGPSRLRDSNKLFVKYVTAIAYASPRHFCWDKQSVLSLAVPTYLGPTFGLESQMQWSLNARTRRRRESMSMITNRTRRAVRALFFGVEVELVYTMSYCSLVRLKNQSFIVDTADLVLEQESKDTPKAA